MLSHKCCPEQNKNDRVRIILIRQRVRARVSLLYRIIVIFNMHILKNCDKHIKFLNTVGGKSKHVSTQRGLWVKIEMEEVGSKKSIFRTF